MSQDGCQNCCCCAQCPPWWVTMGFVPPGGPSHSASGLPPYTTGAGGGIVPLPSGAVLKPGTTSQPQQTTPAPALLGGVALVPTQNATTLVGAALQAQAIAQAQVEAAVKAMEGVLGHLK